MEFLFQNGSFCDHAAGGGRRESVSTLQEVFLTLSFDDSVKIAADIVKPCGQ